MNEGLEVSKGYATYPFEGFLARLKKNGKKIILSSDFTVDGKVYADFYDDTDVATAFGTCSGPASSPPEIDYPRLAASGLVLLSIAATEEYEKLAYDHAELVEMLENDMMAELSSDEVIPFSYDDKELKIETRYVGNYFGHAIIVFELDVSGDEVVGRRAACY